MNGTWDESLETGDAHIDDQHRQLIELTDELMKAEAHPSEVLRVLDKLMEFTITHFLSEEELMREVRYPIDQTNEMIENHLEFKGYTRLRVLEFRREKTVSVLPLHSFLDHWLKVHEFGLDQRLVDWIRRQDGAKSKAA